MADLETTVAELARLRSGSEPIVSVYLDVRWTDEQQRDRVRLFVQDAVRRTLAHYPEGSPGRDGLDRTLGRVQAWAAGLVGQRDEAPRQGVALFACESLGLWREVPVAAPLRNDLATDAVCHLAQLAKVERDASPVLVAAPGPDGADLFAIRLGEVELEERIERPSSQREESSSEPGATRLVAGEGPTSRHERAEKSQRKDEDRARRNRKEAAEELTQLFDRRPNAAIVLVGPIRTLAAFEKQLPARVASRVLARVPRPPEWQSSDGHRRAAARAAAVEAARASALAREGRDVAAVVGEALRGGIAVVGPDDVVLALNEGRVHGLVIEEDFRRTGWRCDNCDALGAEAESAERCPFCGGDLRAVLDLGAALVARTLAVGGTVDVVPRDRRLNGYRGVGAFLRQTAATGLRGASERWPTAPGANQRP